METQVPEYGLKLKLCNRFPNRWRHLPKFKIFQIWSYIGMFLRYIFHYIHCWVLRRKPPEDYFWPQTAQPIYGCPLGGIGAGTIGRGYKGEFCRFQLKPGIYEYNTVDANQFIVTIKDSLQKTLFQSVLSTYHKQTNYLSQWQWLLDGSKCTYTALYPRAWTEYDLSKYGVKLICRQVSPVIPHNYKDSSLPCAIFVWDVENVSSTPRIVTITFTFKSGTGTEKQDREYPSWSKRVSSGDFEGIELHHRIKSMLCTYVLGTKKSEWVTVSKCLFFDPYSDGAKPWKQLYEFGKFKSKPEKQAVVDNGEMACGISCQIRLVSVKSKTVEMCLVWDMPVVNFVNSSKIYKRYYSKFFGTEDNSTPLAEYALNNYQVWEKKIYSWQKPILSDPKLPSWYKAALFNELYYIVDGGTLWFLTGSKKYHSEDPRTLYGRIAILDGHEKRYYNSINALYHSSFALLMNWPHLQESLQYDMADFISREILVDRCTLFDGIRCKRKILNTTPYDIGDPYEEPFFLLNAYRNHDVSKWKDLNLKFILQVFRDYKLMIQYDVNRVKYLKYIFPVCKAIIEQSFYFDKDFDGLIENNGMIDQCYDSWAMTGPSAYCGGLWLSALHAMIYLAQKLDMVDKTIRTIENYSNSFQCGKEAFDKIIWNGVFYNFDCSHRCDTIMADQLCGHWYLRCSGVKYNVFPQQHVSSILKTIYKNNIKQFGDSDMGAVNGFLQDTGTDMFSTQSQEVWIGVTYSLASLMLFEGLDEEGWRTAGGMWKLLNEHLGYSFQTPEAFNMAGFYRSISSSQALCIWSMQLAYEQKKEKKD